MQFLGLASVQEKNRQDQVMKTRFDYLMSRLRVREEQVKQWTRPSLHNSKKRRPRPILLWRYIAIKYGFPGTFISTRSSPLWNKSKFTSTHKCKDTSTMQDQLDQSASPKPLLIGGRGRAQPKNPYWFTLKWPEIGLNHWYSFVNGTLEWDWLRPIRLFPIRAQSGSFLLSSATGPQRHPSSWRHVENRILIRPGWAGGVLVSIFILYHNLRKYHTLPTYVYLIVS